MQWFLQRNDKTSWSWKIDLQFGRRQSCRGSHRSAERVQHSQNKKQMQIMEQSFFLPSPNAKISSLRGPWKFTNVWRMNVERGGVAEHTRTLSDVRWKKFVIRGISTDLDTPVSAPAILPFTMQFYRSCVWTRAMTWLVERCPTTAGRYPWTTQMEKRRSVKGECCDGGRSTCNGLSITHSASSEDGDGEIFGVT